ncbi:IRE (iron responsive element) [Rhodopirellula sp. SM50]|nr:IRE (iron responsive element) [Rhodopirellula sp. SM50]PAY18621.1 IRE (iron responsive element) [Rhodopirellula sp. SM50]
MNQSTAFRRKIIYLVILVATLVPLYLLGQPSDGTADSGGQLATMRQEFGIAESDLGEISPASETMKLASLGLRGVAATLLWEKAHKYRVLHEWDRLKAALNNIALLQPHYDKVWEHQAHNLAYNVSVEFDDYRQRYEMVREGTEFLTRGVRQNRKAPRLIWYTGWFYGQKIGMSDEKRQFRRLFADDTVLHDSLANEGIAVDSSEALGPFQKPDNWLVGRLWLNHGYDVVDAGVEIRRQTPINFYETGPKWSIKHAEAIESEGVLDQRAISAWTKASENWDRFGKRSIPTLARFTVKLGSLADLLNERGELAEKFRKLGGQVYLDMRQEKIDQLPIDMRNVYEKDPEQRTEAGKEAMPNILAAIEPNFREVAQRLPTEKQLPALQILDEIDDLDQRIQKTDGLRKQINYVYWESLSMAEQEDRTVKARKLIYDAEKANREAEVDLAIKLYLEAFQIWYEIFEDYPVLTIDDSAEDLYASIRRYMIMIDSEELSEDFPLSGFAEMMEQGLGRTSPESYERFRKEQEELAAKRQKELEEEERRREAEAAKEMKADAESPAEEPPAKETPAEEPVEEVETTEKADESSEDEAAAEETPESESDGEAEESESPAQ